ncbi:hypothetical protein CALVIDRAFT_566071 [Calocera viscosa TUFC12733]|uniref:Zn(2)-C6 fungal-type domain-containing protein n=1 Tax=Calocera viscosa (strain TUFC12733) TaxID=1330018 RepID=A0A167JRT8_CALVF|nr:hypothetical protein CALVIDRAFT_566071 [Calocera viscosa TUFC12733]
MAPRRTAAASTAATASTGGTVTTGAASLTAKQLAKAKMEEKAGVNEMWQGDEKLRYEWSQNEDQLGSWRNAVVKYWIAHPEDIKTWPMEQIDYLMANCQVAWLHRNENRRNIKFIRRNCVDTVPGNPGIAQDLPDDFLGEEPLAPTPAAPTAPATPAAEAPAGNTRPRRTNVDYTMRTGGTVATGGTGAGSRMAVDKGQKRKTPPPADTDSESTSSPDTESEYEGAGHGEGKGKGKEKGKGREEEEEDEEEEGEGDGEAADGDSDDSDDWEIAVKTRGDEILQSDGVMKTAKDGEEPPPDADAVFLMKRCKYCRRRKLHCFKKKGRQAKACWHCSNAKTGCSVARKDGRAGRVGKKVVKKRSKAIITAEIKKAEKHIRDLKKELKTAADSEDEADSESL